MWYKDMAQREEEHLERLKELQDVKSDLAGYKALVVELKGKESGEEAHHIFRAKLWETQRKLASTGYRKAQPADEVKQLREECRVIAAEEGENSAAYKKKRKFLERLLKLRYEESLKHKPPPPTGEGTS